MLLQACHQLRMKGRWGGEVDFEDQMDAKLRTSMFCTKDKVVGLFGGWDKCGIVMFGFYIYIYIVFSLLRNGNCHPASDWKMERARVLKFQMAATPLFSQEANCKHLFFFFFEASPVPKLFNTWNKHLKDMKKTHPHHRSHENDIYIYEMFLSCISMFVSSFVGWWFQSLFVLRTWFLCWKEVLHPYCPTASMNHRWPRLGSTNRICDVTLAGRMGKNRSNSQDHD